MPIGHDIAAVSDHRGCVSMRTLLAIWSFLAFAGTGMAARDGGYEVADTLWAKAVLQVASVPVTPVTLAWMQVGKDTIAGGARVVSGYFYADPAALATGSPYNPEVFVKIFIAADGWCNIAFNHVTVDDVDVYSAHRYAGSPDQSGTAALTRRLVEHRYDGVGIDPPASASYAIGHASCSFAGTASPSSPDLPVELYYPADTAGDDTRISSGPFPVILFAHGYQQSYLDYACIWEEMVPAGYIVALLNRLAASLTIDIDAYALDIELALQRIREMGKDPGSPFYGHVGEKYVLMGHSTGGGALFIAVSKPESAAASNTAAIVSLAPLGQVYGPISGRNPVDAAPAVTVPTLIIDGAKDCITPRDTHAQILYDRIGACVNKYIITIADGDHCGFSDEAGPGQSKCTLAEWSACMGLQGPTMAADEQNKLATGFLKQWIDHFVKDAEKAWNAFQDLLRDTRITYRSGT